MILQDTNKFEKINKQDILWRNEWMRVEKIHPAASLGALPEKNKNNGEKNFQNDMKKQKKKGKCEWRTTFQHLSGK